ncbi:MAG TPA: hypothetical protein VHZ95_23110, partial [Polyangiales bacterium]|nr:hypothetical protein [Polyangiales bacterium]
MNSAAEPNPDADHGIPERTLRHVEWSRLQAAWIARCKGEGARRAGLTFARDFASARVALAETAETMQLMAAGEPLPLEALRDIAGHLDRLDRGGVLDAPALADIRVALQHAGAIRRFLGARREKLP